MEKTARKLDNKKNRLLVLCQIFYPELISTGQTLTELCEQLSANGVEIEVLCAQPTIVKMSEKVPRIIDYKGITIKRVMATTFPKLQTLGRIINQITYALSTFIFLLFDRSKRPILVLTNPPFLAFFCAFLRSIGLGQAYIYLVFDVYPETAINLGMLKKNSLIAKIWQWFNTFSFAQASKIIVIGRCMEEIIQKKVSNNDKKKIKMIPVWCDDIKIRESLKKTNPLVERWGIKDKYVVSYSGNMGRFHDMETIIRAAHELNDKKDIIFLFTGEGYKKRILMDYVNKNRMKNCMFFSYVDREMLGFALSCANIGLVSLLPDQVGLSVPSKAYGYMAAGVPIIAIVPEKSEIALVINKENCGKVVKPGEYKTLSSVILELYNQPQILKTLGTNAGNAIDNKYSLKKTATAYFDLIDELNSTC